MILTPTSPITQAIQATFDLETRTLAGQMLNLSEAAVELTECGTRLVHATLIFAALRLWNQTAEGNEGIVLHAASVWFRQIAELAETIADAQRVADTLKEAGARR